MARKTFVKAFIDPDLRKDWKKFLKKFPYLFWVQAMNIEEEKDWIALVSKRKPDLRVEPRVPVGAADYAAISKARRDVYFCLARSFSEPSIGLVNDLQNESFLEVLDRGMQLFVPSSRTQEGLKILREYIIAVKNEDKRKLLRRLRGEHLTIFYDSFFPWLSCYESVYRGEKQIMGDLTAMVKDSYRFAGYSLTGEYGNDPPDDAKIELEFMYRLCEDELQSWLSGDKDAVLSYLDMQRFHLWDHLIEWIPFLCDDLLTPEFREGVVEKFQKHSDLQRKKSKEFEFYVSIATLTKAVLESDYNQVATMGRIAREIDADEVAKGLHGTEPIDTSTERFALEKSSK